MRKYHAGILTPQAKGFFRARQDFSTRMRTVTHASSVERHLLTRNTMICEILVPGRVEKATVNIKPGVTVLMIDNRRVYMFDTAGRLISARTDTCDFRRNLQNRAVVKAVDGSWLALELKESKELIQGVYDEVVKLSDYGRAWKISPRKVKGKTEVTMCGKLECKSGECTEETPLRLWSILGYSFDVLEVEALQYKDLWGRVPIIPPDCTPCIYAQLTVGCNWGKCTFCDLYCDRAFVVRTPDEFHKHLQGIKEFFGDGIKFRRRLFLGDANPLVAPADALLHAFEQLNISFDIPQGISCFADGSTTDYRTREDFKTLAMMGLTRVYIGLETGSRALYKSLEKPGTLGKITQLIRMLKSCDISAGIIVMAGIGDEKTFEKHLEATTAFAAAQELGEGDIIQVSPFVDERNISHFSRMETEVQATKLAHLLRKEVSKAGVRVAKYSIENFQYY